jgi:23S rRNA pseudouridine955/2504/2580 synthase
MTARNPSAVRHVPIAERDAGQRVDNYLLRTLKGVPRSHVYRLLRSGQVRVNGGRVKPDRKLQAGDQLRLPPVMTAAASQPRRAPDELLQRVRAAICHEDEHFLVLNKPPDLPVHGGSGVAYGLIEVLRQARPQDAFLELGHRLDRETSGCLVVARSRAALTALHAALREGRAEKLYRVLLVGAWQGGIREVDEALAKNRRQGGEHKVQTAADGRAARSRFLPGQVLRLPGGIALSLMQVRIFTGRTHQIRVHAAHLEHPVAGDGKYGDFEVNRRLREWGLKRMFLHAESLCADLPVLGRRLAVQAPLAADLQGFLDRIGG